MPIWDHTFHRYKKKDRKSGGIFIAIVFGILGFAAFKFGLGDLVVALAGN